MTAPSIEELFAWYRAPVAHRMYDEVVTELEHALQCAALAQAEGAPEGLVAAALFHDVGHLVLDDNVGLDEELAEDHHHEQAGARYLAQWFGPAVTAPVALHVAAKRYLCATDAEYVARLSPSSVRSLGVQGGPMTEAQVASFERNAHHRDAVQVRRWDDEAKIANVPTPPLEHYERLLRSLAG